MIERNESTLMHALCTQTACMSRNVQVRDVPDSVPFDARLASAPGGRATVEVLPVDG